MEYTAASYTTNTLSYRDFHHANLVLCSNSQLLLTDSPDSHNFVNLLYCPDYNSLENKTLINATINVETE